MIDALLVRHLTSALVFAAVGIVIFVLAFALLVRVLPFSVRKEIEDDQNVALALLIASVVVGVAIVVGMAVRG